MEVVDWKGRGERERESNKRGVCSRSDKTAVDEYGPRGELFIKRCHLGCLIGL